MTGSQAVYLSRRFELPCSWLSYLLNKFPSDPAPPSLWTTADQWKHLTPPGSRLWEGGGREAGIFRLGGKTPGLWSHSLLPRGVPLVGSPLLWIPTDTE